MLNDCKNQFGNMKPTNAGIKHEANKSFGSNSASEVKPKHFLLIPGFYGPYSFYRRDTNDADYLQWFKNPKYRDSCYVAHIFVELKGFLF